MFKFIAIAALVVVASAQVLDSDSILRNQFADFIVRNDRMYASSEEMEYRFQVYKKNIAQAEQWNSERVGENDAIFGETIFSDWTEAELTETYLSSKRDRSTFDAPTMDLSKVLSNKQEPDEFDWRDQDGVVSAVKDQGNCGSCWAFAATEYIESQWFLATGEAVELSTQHLVDCDKTSGGCNGGLEINGWKYIKDKTAGQQLEADYPYEARNGKCRYDESKAKVPIASAQWFPSQDEYKQRKWLAENGPLDVGVAANNKWFSYKGGVLMKKDCPASGINHGVNAVGYGTFEDGTQYWTVRNSWGGRWGLDGYILLEFDAGTCAINKEAATAEVKV